MFGKPRAPEKVIKDVEIYLSDVNVPNYAATQALKKSVRAYPDNTKLKEKLKEIEENLDINISQSSPKILYGILVIALGVMGLGLLISYIINKANLMGLVLGVSFIIAAVIIYKQYLKEK